MRTTLLLLLSVISAAVHSQPKVSLADSINLKNQIEGFYVWYVGMIKAHTLNTSFNPAFVKREDGMTTLDFARYRSGLQKHKFSEHHIQRRVDAYKACVDNLSKIPFEKFSQLNDLDDFERIKCDFLNRYEWIDTMEPIDRPELVSLKRRDADTIVGEVIFYWYEPGSKALVTFKRNGKEWLTDDLIITKLSDSAPTDH